MPPRNQHQADSQAGFAVGKRVWVKESWDGLLLLKRLGEHAEGMTVADEKTDPYGRITVRLGDGTPEPLRKDLLRLTPPPSATGKAAKAKEPKPAKREEAIDPAFGYEQTIFDFLG